MVEMNKSEKTMWVPISEREGFILTVDAIFIKKYRFKKSSGAEGNMRSSSDE